MQKESPRTRDSRAVIPAISLVALPCGDAETASGGTRQHQNASSEASSRYSHSIEKTLSSLFQFAAVCSSLSHLHLVSKNASNPWGQIWVKVIRVSEAISWVTVGHENRFWFLNHDRKTSAVNLCWPSITSSLDVA